MRLAAMFRRNSALAVMLLAGTLALALGRDDWSRTLTEPTADAAYYYVYLPSLFLDRDLDFSNQYEVTKNWYGLDVTSQGKPGNVFGIGPALLQAPAFLLGHALARISGSRSDGFSQFETALVLWTSVLFSIGALCIAAKIATRRVGPGASSLVGAAAALLAGPVAYYAVRQPGYSHPYATFFVAWLVERWDASYELPGPRPLRTWITLGLALGLATLVRPQLSLWSLLLVGAAVSDLRKRGTVSVSKIVGRWAVAGLVAALAFSPQLFAWKTIYGDWYVVPQGADFMRWDEPAWVETLFSSRNGLFPWAPLYIPMLGGLALVKQRFRFGTAMLVGLLSQAMVNGAAWDWWAGGSFGGRRFDSTYVFFAVGASALFHRGGKEIVRALETPRDPLGKVWLHKLAAFGIAVAFLLASMVVIAQVQLMLKTSVVTARIAGGEAASQVWRRRVGGATGTVAATLSTCISMPVAAVFALRHDVNTSAYNHMVGVHLLGELYPGLNGSPDKRLDFVRFKNLGEPWFRGLKLRQPELAEMIATSARMYVGLNRRPPIRVRLRLVAEGSIRIRWNDEILLSRELKGSEVIDLEIQDLRRGPNWLIVEAPVGTLLNEPELRAP